MPKPIPGLADRLELAMRRRGLSQAELARRLGVGRATVTHWFVGRNTPKLAVLIAAAEELSVTVGWLVTGDEGQEPEPIEATLLRLSRGKHGEEIAMLLEEIEPEKLYRLLKGGRSRPKRS